ncbi:DUF4148 domain-containing protein [Caballeronia grimmiae]|uniref:DUF4148 domain-containing protein n=1 Tax=Caballeronia grimmiae TaxID=1071679 RepID=UPI0038BA701F
MKASGLLAATLLLSAGSVLAAESVAGKTCAQARQDLVQAWKDGWFPYNRHDYPPSAASLARNKARYYRSHPNHSNESYHRLTAPGHFLSYVSIRQGSSSVISLFDASFKDAFSLPSFPVIFNTLTAPLNFTC